MRFTTITCGLAMAGLPLVLLLVACGGGSEKAKPSEPAASSSGVPAVPQLAPPAARPHDDTRYLPKANLVDSGVVLRNLMDKPFMPGGTLGKYKKGKTEYQIFIARTATPDAAAMLLPDWRKALTGAKLLPSFGGYFGEDAGRSVFVFAKGSWIAGIAGLGEKDADLEARTLAGRLN
jgi:hypothetical protein